LPKDGSARPPCGYWLPPGSSTKPASRVPASAPILVARYWRPLLLGSAITFTGSAKSATLTGLSPWYSCHAAKMLITRWRSGSRALIWLIRTTGSQQPRATSGSRTQTPQSSKLPSALPCPISRVFCLPHRRMVRPAVSNTGRRALMSSKSPFGDFRPDCRVF
jgi:hypothetical protein